MVSSLRLSLMLLCLLWIVPSYGDPVLSCYHFTIDDGLAYQVVRDFAQTPDGVMWLATWGGGISRYDGMQWKTFTVKDGLVDNMTPSPRSG